MTMFQRAGGWCESGTYGVSEWICEEQGETDFSAVACDVIPALKDRVLMRSCVPEII